MDITTYNAGGYHGDLNETFCVGKVDADGQRLVQTAFECLAAAMALVKPGTLYRDLGQVIERHAKKNKCSVVRTYCGHGIGSLFHTVCYMNQKYDSGLSSFGIRICLSHFHFFFVQLLFSDSQHPPLRQK